MHCKVLSTRIFFSGFPGLKDFEMFESHLNMMTPRKKIVSPISLEYKSILFGNARSKKT